jgi:RimJ/RimL family protein N-acetyltransferase
MPRWSATDDAGPYADSLLRGDRVQLRATTDADIATLAQWYGDPSLQVLQSDQVKPLPAATAAETIRGWSTNQDQSGAGFSIELTSDGQLIGHVTLWGARPTTRAASFAIMLGPDFASQGYGTEATRLMLGYGFRELGLNRIELRTWAFNRRAIAAYTKAGFTVEGRRREVLFHDGVFHDELIMSVLAAEYFGGGT